MIIYFQMLGKTAEEFTDDGFFVSGDLGIVHSDGYISIVGREKDLIITGGLNVYPKDVEVIINQCKAVVESAVIGIADSDLGEQVVAIIVCDDQLKLASTDLFSDKMGNDKKGNEQLSTELLDAEIKLMLDTKLAKFKHPKQLYYVDELPRNTMGKVQKNKLRDSYSLR